jgi:hypothetical protein
MCAMLANREIDSFGGQSLLCPEVTGDSVKRMSVSALRRKESELIVAILAGDAQLYHQLIRPYERFVYMISLSYMKNEKDAEEATQEIFIRAFRDLRYFRDDSGFDAWLINIALSESKHRSLQRVATVSFDELGASMPLMY